VISLKPVPVCQGYGVPILVIFWNRPTPLARLLDILASVQPRQLYLACDGPRSNDGSNQQLVQRCRDLVEQRITWPVQVQRRYADINQGCRAGVAGAISWFFEHEAEGIVLEDDVHPEPSFFPFMQELLERYRHDSRVGSISSHHFHRQPSAADSTYRFSVYNHCWGWGSWRRAWSQYDASLTTWPAFRDEGLLEGLGNRRFQRYWTRILNATARGEIDTWDFAWTYSHWKAGMLSCVPDRCLVRNAGFGPNATHTNAEACPLPEPQAIDVPLRHPEFLRPSPFHDRLTQRYQYCQPTLLQRLLRKWRRWRQVS
jgi:hypothetical protein